MIYVSMLLNLILLSIIGGNMVRKKKRKPKHSFGGHVLNPDERCIQPDKIFKNRSNRWIDAGELSSL